MLVIDDFGSERPLLAEFFYVAAYLVGIGAFAWMARRRGIATNGIAVIALAGLLGGALGAQVFESLFGGVPGKSLLGGIAGGYLAVIYTKTRLGIRRPTGDLFAVALAAGETVGRFGCLFAGCCYGRATTIPWAIYDHGAWRHPTQIYSSIAALATLAILIAFERRRILAENGLFFVQGLLLCSSRFEIEFLRDVPVTAIGLTTAQIACAAGAIFFAWRIARMTWPRSDENRATRAARA